MYTDSLILLISQKIHEKKIVQQPPVCFFVGLQNSAEIPLGRVVVEIYKAVRESRIMESYCVYLVIKAFSM